MNNRKQCPICNGESNSPFLVCKDNTVSKENFKIVSCDDCGFKFTNPIPEENKIGDYYKSEEYISHSNTKKGLVNKAYQTVRNITLKQKENLISEGRAKGILLDIGCGTGEFLNYCIQSGWNGEGIEPDESAQKLGKENYGITVSPESRLSDISEKTIDVITMWHVLEHVYHLKERVETLKRILKDDGTIYIAVPNYESYDAIKYKEHWAAYDVPRHLYHFGKSDIKRLMEKSGMYVDAIHPMKFDSFYVSMLSEKYSTGKINFVSALMTGLKSNSEGAKTMNYSSLIYKIKKQPK
tara:strand:- start:5020 stop:5907 length:888 start_codon:yes stop_codon:yes gene_type:complete